MPAWVGVRHGGTFLAVKHEDGAYWAQDLMAASLGNEDWRGPYESVEALQAAEPVKKDAA